VKAKEFDFRTRFIELAGEINAHMPYFVVENVMEALSQRGKALRGARVLVLGWPTSAILTICGIALAYHHRAAAAARALVEYNDRFLPLSAKDANTRST